MNLIESYTISNPQNKTDMCARFTIDDTTDKFVLSEIAEPGQKYMLSFWVKSEATGNLIFRFHNYPTSTAWQKYDIPFTPEEKYLLLKFSVAGTYYIYHPQLEIGDKATDWTPAPEDAEEQIKSSIDGLAKINDELVIINKNIADLAVNDDSIVASVNTLRSDVDKSTGRLNSIDNDISTLKLSSTQLDLKFQSIANDGVTKVATETGFTFDREGMTVDSNDSTTKTQVTPDGMTVYKKDADGTQDEVLEATSEGVNATNLHAKTYLIIGGRSRFENYGENRTGCFWIGG